MLRDRNAIIDVLRQAGIATSAIPAFLKSIEPYGQPTSEAGSPLKLLERADLDHNGIVLKLSLAPLMPAGSEAIEVDRLTMTQHIPLTMKRRGLEMRLVIDGGPPISRTADPALAKALARAHRWFDDLYSGRAKSTAEIAAREGIQPRYVRRLLSLALLAPDIVEAIAQGSQPLELTAYRLTQLDAPPVDWSAQRQLLGFQ